MIRRWDGADTIKVLPSCTVVVSGIGRKDGIFRYAFSKALKSEIDEDNYCFHDVQLNRDELRLAFVALNSKAEPLFVSNDSLILCFGHYTRLSERFVRVDRLNFWRDDAYYFWIVLMQRRRKRILQSRRRLALAMALHSRLGAKSLIAVFPVELLQRLLLS